MTGQHGLFWPLVRPVEPPQPPANPITTTSSTTPTVTRGASDE
jgi:hypothetical protein